MKYIPYSTALTPNIVVDGSANEHTRLTLSHWPHSGTPEALKGDTSAEIVFNYLDAPEFHVDVETVTNNHFDQDGLVGIFAMLHPATAARHRDLLIEVASAGDFGVFKSRDAARINFAIASLSDPAVSPLPREIFNLRYPDMAAELYVRLLDVLPRMLTTLNDYQSLWDAEDRQLSDSEKLVRQGVVSLEERKDLDLVIVRIPEHLSTHSAHRFTTPRKVECHPHAIFNATSCTRVFHVQGQRVEFQYRYESWVQLKSRTPQGRVDLSALAAELNREEIRSGRWIFDGVDQITPRLYLDGHDETSIPPDVILHKLEHHLRTLPASWNPYD